MSATTLTDLRKFILNGKWQLIIDAMKRDPAHVRERNIPLALEFCPDIPDDVSKEIFTLYWRFVNDDHTGEKSTKAPPETANVDVAEGPPPQPQVSNASAAQPARLPPPQPQPQVSNDARAVQLVRECLNIKKDVSLTRFT